MLLQADLAPMGLPSSSSSSNGILTFYPNIFFLNLKWFNVYSVRSRLLDHDSQSNGETVAIDMGHFNAQSQVYITCCHVHRGRQTQHYSLFIPLIMNKLLRLLYTMIQLRMLNLDLVQWKQSNPPFLN